MLGLGFRRSDKAPPPGQAKALGADSPASSPHPAAGRQGGADSTVGKGPDNDSAQKPGAAARPLSCTCSPADLRQTPRTGAAAAPGAASPSVQQQAAPQAQAAPQTPVQSPSVQKSPQAGQALPPALAAKASPEAKSSPAAGGGESAHIKLLLKDVENLPKKDLMGTCDAYAVAAVGESQRFMTDVVWN